MKTILLNLNEYNEYSVTPAAAGFANLPQSGRKARHRKKSQQENHDWRDH